MGGGHKNIKPEDGVPFEKGNQAAAKWTEESANQLADEMLEWIKSGGHRQIFFNEFLLINKGLYTDLPAYLSRKYDSFRKKMDIANETQRVKLLKYGVEDTLNQGMTKFALMNIHGMSEKVSTDNKNTEVKMTGAERKARKAELIKKLKK